MIYTFILQGNLMDSLVGTLPLLGIVAVFYFFMIRPQAKKQKKQVSFVSNMEKGDQVVTNSGMIGRINKIEDHVVTLQIDTKTFVKVLKSSISSELTESFGKEEE